MSLKKYSFLSIFCYGLIFISPLILASIGLVKSTSELITATAVMYILGAVVLAIFYFKQREPLAIESAVKKASAPKIVIYGLVGIFVALILQSIAVMLESVLFGKATPSENTQNIIQMIMEAPAFILATTVAGPIMEEFVFRRSILGIISRYSNFWVGAVISSLLFAFAHNDGHLLFPRFLLQPRVQSNWSDLDIDDHTRRNEHISCSCSISCPKRASINMTINTPVILDW